MDYAFKPSTDSIKGISVVDLDCISNQDTDFCKYIEENYSPFSSPVIAWFIPEGYLPDEHRIVEDEEDEGELCHRNIINLARKGARKLFDNAWKDSRENFMYCDDGDLRQLQDSDLANI